MVGQGCWNAIEDGLSRHLPEKVEDRLMCAAYLVLALVKTRQFSRAADELQQLGDLDSPEFMRETPHGSFMCITS